MALSVVETLTRHGRVDQDALARSFGERFERGYGPAMYDLLPQLRAGVPWQTASRALFGGQGSFGNGVAMRVAPLGAYFAGDLPLVVEQAALATEVTYAHPEAVAWPPHRAALRRRRSGRAGRRCDGVSRRQTSG